ncbi:MAG: transglutaminaseTgpA domain-containing protein [Planctomycetales bacterium]
MGHQTPLQRTLVISVFVLICFAGGILTSSVGYFFPTGLTIPIAILAFILNEHLRILRINLVTANVLAALGFVIAGFQFFGDDPEAKLLAPINLLCYVQWTLLFVDKNEEQYWWHIALSILQVAASAVLTFNAWYGFVLALFIPLMIWTLAVYIMFLSDQQFRKSQGLDLALASEDVSANSVVTPQGRWRQAQTFSTATLRSFEDLRQSQSSVTNSIRLNSRKAWITSPFVIGTSLLSAAACLLGGLIFLSVPRVWIEGGTQFQDIVNSRNGGAARQTLSGFTQEIKLGDVGEILQNPQPVFRVKFVEHSKNQTISAYEYARKLGLEEPLFRGAVLTTYDKGRWKPLEEAYGQFERLNMLNIPAFPPPRNRDGGPRGGGPRGRGFGRFGPPPSIPSELTDNLVRQEYRLEPIGVSTLFSMGPVIWGGQRNRRLNVEIQSETFDLHYDLREEPSGVQYELFTLDHIPQEYKPQLNAGIEFYQLRDNRKVFRQIQKRQFPGLVKLAEELKTTALASYPRNRTPNSPKDTKEPDTSDIWVANAFVNHLSRPDQFTYALNVPVVDTKLDPVEDFIVNRKRGHCEYFASALALMLRAVDIPSRVVNGFKGGTELRDKTLEVQQRFAHSWVEAHVGGRWQTFDPTPTAARTETLDESRPDLARMVRAAIMENWIAYVINLNTDRQWELVEPLWISMQQSFSEFDPRDWPNEILAWCFLILSEPWRIFTWLGAAIFAFILIIVAAIYFIGRKLLTLYRRISGQNGTVGITIQSGILFFSNFLKLMAKRGIKPTPAQTPGEFVSTALNKIDGLPQETRDFGGRMTQAFYQVRFGHEELSPSQEHDLSNGIDRLSHDLSHRNGNGKSKGKAPH